MTINIELAYSYKQEIKQLFHEYTQMLIQENNDFQHYLDIQNYNQEIEHLKEKYGLPKGRLYVIKVDNEIVGCIGLRQLDQQNCEMKRLYILPKMRGKHLSDLLIKKIIEDAKEIGYEYMLLDTLPFLKSAIHLYQKYGFYEIESYNNSPINDTIYMKLNLNEI